MKTATRQKIIKYIEEKKQATASELVDFLEISPRAVFKQLRVLYSTGILDKVGRPPRVFYFIKEKKKPEAFYSVSDAARKIIARNFLVITPGGEKKEGMKGFVYWCKKSNQPVEKTALEYEKTFKKYARYKKDNFIDGTYKLANTFDRIYLEKIYYLDFYSIERFGKTKLGWMLLYAKQSQDRKLIKELILTFKDKVEHFIAERKIDAVGFVPPTLKRDVQFMNQLAKILNLELPKIAIVKVKTPIIVAQKSLTKLSDRVENVRKTIQVVETRRYKNILLIDDAIGSGATINETARKVRERGICMEKIYGLAITGSFKGFEVISEV